MNEGSSQTNLELVPVVMVKAGLLATDAFHGVDDTPTSADRLPLARSLVNVWSNASALAEANNAARATTVRGGHLAEVARNGISLERRAAKRQRRLGVAGASSTRGRAPSAVKADGRRAGG